MCAILWLSGGVGLCLQSAAHISAHAENGIARGLCIFGRGTADSGERGSLSFP